MSVHLMRPISSLRVGLYIGEGGFHVVKMSNAVLICLTAVIWITVSFLLQHCDVITCCICVSGPAVIRSFGQN